MQGYRLDPEGGVADEHYALVYAPRRVRDRFAESCVQVVASAEAARAGMDIARHRYAARVMGPARSSEGLRIYYLVAWLE